MSTDFTQTPAELLGELINLANPGAAIPLASLTFGVPEALVGDPDYNTQVVVTGGNGYKDSVTIRYNRKDIDLFPGALSRTFNRQDYVNASDLLSTVLSRFGVNLSAADIVDAVLPATPDATPVALPVTMAPGSLVYTGVMNLLLTLPMAVDVGALITVTDLVGMEFTPLLSESDISLTILNPIFPGLVFDTEANYMQDPSWILADVINQAQGLTLTGDDFYINSVLPEAANGKNTTVILGGNENTEGTFMVGEMTAYYDRMDVGTLHALLSADTVYPNYGGWNGNELLDEINLRLGLAIGAWEIVQEQLPNTPVGVPTNYTLTMEQNNGLFIGSFEIQLLMPDNPL